MKFRQELFPVKNILMIRISTDFKKAEEVLKSGGIVVAPTDTLYGILADALNPEAVEKVYKLKKRKGNKPVIVLIPSVEYLKLFDVYPKKEEIKLLKHGGITVIIPLKDSKKFFYLHRGAGSIAFRIPKKEELIKLMKNIKKPLIAPSANPEGKNPAKDIDEAVAYFGDSIDLYIDGGEIKSSIPSTIVKVNSQVQIIREGSVKKEHIDKIIKSV